jgi:Helix-turn-helix.
MDIPPDGPKQRVAAAVSAALDHAGIKPHAAAAATGIPRTTLERRLSGIGKAFDLDELSLLANLLDISVIDLIEPRDAA